jgi:hypothetical protein
MLVYPDTSGFNLALLSVFQCFSVSVFRFYRITARTAQPNHRARSATELPSGKAATETPRAQRNRITERQSRNRTTARTAQPNHRAHSATEPPRGKAAAASPPPDTLTTLRLHSCFNPWINFTTVECRVGVKNNVPSLPR